MLSVMMSALISSLTSVFNSISTIFTIDVWQRLRKNPSDMELMLVGRVAVMVLIVISIISIPIVRNVSGLGFLFFCFCCFLFFSPVVVLSCCLFCLFVVCFLLLFGWMGGWVCYVFVVACVFIASNVVVCLNSLSLSV